MAKRARLDQVLVARGLCPTREQAQRAGAGFDESGAARSGWKLAKKNDNLAVEIAAIARHRQRIGASGAAETLRALYVRPSDPELKECR